ncbi:hypothetical protein SDC9_75461 [bioreactor metagenome]|uniref:Uncharacterized protein n=1 Tax=bioreactor metagenome TaxID=1076179 RepID=A0A644YR32_9ZZZZ
MQCQIGIGGAGQDVEQSIGIGARRMPGDDGVHHLLRAACVAEAAPGEVTDRGAGASAHGSSA